MDKNTITGFVLIAAVLIGFSWWNQPSEEQMAQMRQQDSLQEVARKKAEEAKKAAQLAATEKKAQKLAQAQQDTAALFHSALSGNAQQVVLKNKKLELTLSTKGGTVTKAVIRAIKTRKAIPTSYSSTKKSSSSSSCFQARNRISSQATYSSHRQT